MTAPNIGGTSVKLFKEKFKNSSQAIPDICEDEFNIRVYKQKPEDDVPSLSQTVITIGENISIKSTLENNETNECSSMLVNDNQW